jgi:hypothetical protein
MNYYDPPEPEWAGRMEFTCSAEVNRKFITPEMEKILRSFSEEPADPWAANRTDEEVREMRVRMMTTRVNALLREWASIEGMDRTCGWEGEAECFIDRGRLGWDCPACGEEHDDPAPEPDAPEPYDTLKEAWGEA